MGKGKEDSKPVVVEKNSDKTIQEKKMKYLVMVLTFSAPSLSRFVFDYIFSLDETSIFHDIVLFNT